MKFEQYLIEKGHVYLTGSSICFYSNVFGMDKKFCIAYVDIKKISKANTAMFIPNAILVETGGQQTVY